MYPPSHAHAEKIARNGCRAAVLVRPGWALALALAVAAGCGEYDVPSELDDTPKFRRIPCETLADCAVNELCLPEGFCAACLADRDCDSGQVCSPLGACIAQCITDADCRGAPCNDGRCEIGCFDLLDAVCSCPTESEAACNVLRRQVQDGRFSQPECKTRVKAYQCMPPSREVPVAEPTGEADAAVPEEPCQAVAAQFCDCNGKLDVPCDVEVMAAAFCSAYPAREACDRACAAYITAYRESGCSALPETLFAGR